MFVLLFSALCKVLSVLKLTLFGQIDVGKVDCRGADDVLLCLDELDERDFVKILFHVCFSFEFSVILSQRQRFAARPFIVSVLIIT